MRTRRRPRPHRRPPAGAAVLQADVSAAIARAALRELAANGYRGMSMEAIARRAGVGKAALYRRWPSKRAMVAALTSDWVAQAAEVEEAGTLERDLENFLAATLKLFIEPLASKVFSDLIAEARRDPKLAAILHSGLQHRRDGAQRLLARAQQRDELPPDLDLPLALDLLIAPIYWRAIVTQGDTAEAYLRRVTQMLMRAFNATPRV